jgi:hypothetical protein
MRFERGPIMTRLLWIILYAFLLALALLPPFRRMLDEFDQTTVFRPGSKYGKIPQEQRLAHWS